MNRSVRQTQIERMIHGADGNAHQLGAIVEAEKERRPVYTSVRSGARGFVRNAAFALDPSTQFPLAEMDGSSCVYRAKMKWEYGAAQQNMPTP